jgi:hypothetical protein
MASQYSGDMFRFGLDSRRPVPYGKFIYRHYTEGLYASNMEHSDWDLGVRI